MKPLPPALNSRYSVVEAVRIWLSLRYGIDAPTLRQRQAVIAELEPIIQSATVEAARPPNRVRMPSPGFAPPDWQIGGPDRPRAPKARTRRWIDQADLIAFAAERGVDLAVGNAPKPTPRAKPGPRPKNTEAVEFAESLIADGMQQTQAVLEAADKFGAKQDSIDRTIRRRRERQ